MWSSLAPHQVVISCLMISRCPSREIFFRTPLLLCTDPTSASLCAMADPFSVTGRAVSVAFLGLSVCQGLLVYYGPYRSFHQDVDDAIARVEALTSLMTVLHGTAAISSVA
jgi:hypothetical protein